MNTFLEQQGLSVEAVFQSLPSPHIVVAADDPDFTILEQNQAHADVSLVRREDVLGKPVLEAFPDTSEEYRKTGVSQLIESFRRVIITGKPDEMPRLKYDLLDENGTPQQRYWSVRHYPVFGNHKKVAAIFQTTEDITEEVVTEQKLVRTERQLQQALSVSQVGTWVWDIASQRVIADNNLVHMFGLSKATAGKGLALEELLRVIHPGDRVRVENEIHQAVLSGKPYESEYRIIAKKGAIRWVIARGKVELDSAGLPISFPGAVVDITDRKSAENNLNFLTKASTQFSASLDYKQTLATIAAMTVPALADWCSIEMLDEDGVLQQVTVAHTDPKKAAWAKKLRQKQGPPDMKAPTGLAKVIRTGEPELYPAVTDAMLVASAKSPEELALMRDLDFSSVMIVPLKIDDTPVGAIMLVSAESKMRYNQSDLRVMKGFANRAAMAVENAQLFKAVQRELAERKKLQDQLEERVKERTQALQEYSKNLIRSNQELQDFAYVASHDLQEPLRKIQAFGDLLESECADELGEGKMYLDRMRSAASRMSTLIEDLLAFSRVSTQQRPVVAVDLCKTVTEVLGDLETRIARTKGEVDFKKLPVVEADPTHMRQLLQNLIGNALKFHRPKVPPRVHVFAKAVSSNAAMIELHIKDNGIGFDEKYLDRIFSVFQRLHGKDSYEGTGIGLAVCRKIAEQYGGSITAISKKGVGSTFIVTLPLKKEEKKHE